MSDRNCRYAGVEPRTTPDGGRNPRAPYTAILQSLVRSASNRRRHHTPPNTVITFGRGFTLNPHLYCKISFVRSLFRRVRWAVVVVVVVIITAPTSVLWCTAIISIITITYYYYYYIVVVRNGGYTAAHAPDGRGNCAERTVCRRSCAPV